MRRLGFAVALFIFSAGVALAQNGRWEKAFLWQVEKGAKKIYLLGGLSAGKKAHYPMPQSVASAIEDSDVVVLESDIEDIAGSERAVELGLLPEGESLDRHISRELYEELSAVALNYDIPESQFRAMRPWMLYFQIVFRAFADAGYQTDYSTETIVYALAKGSNKPVIGMQSGDWSAQYLNSMAAHLQEAMLRGLLLELRDDGVTKSLDDLWKAMRRGDAANFQAIAEASERLYPRADELRDILFYARYPAMMEKIDAYLDSGKTHLVVLGAINLLGERGLIAQLQKKGYTVKQL